MAVDTHIWLIHPTAARGEAGLLARMRLQLLGRRPAGGLMGWLARLVAWWQGRTAVAALLPLVSEEVDLAREQAVLLGRRLGPAYRCRALVQPDAVERAMASLGRQDRVILIPMGLLPGAALLADAVGRAEAALARHPHQARVPSLADHPDAQEICCEPLREALIQGRGQGPYGILFTAGAASEAPRAHERAVEKVRAGLATHLGSRAPHQLAWSPAGAWPLAKKPGLKEAVAALREAGATRILVVPLDELRGDRVWRGELEAAVRKVGGEELRFGLAPPLGARPSLVGVVADLIGEAEVAAGWRELQTSQVEKV